MAVRTGGRRQLRLQSRVPGPTDGRGVRHRRATLWYSNSPCLWMICIEEVIQLSTGVCGDGWEPRRLGDAEGSELALYWGRGEESLYGRTWRCCLRDRCDVETLPGWCPLKRATALILRNGQRDGRCFDKNSTRGCRKVDRDRRRSNDELERGDLTLVLPNSKLPGVC